MNQENNYNLEERILEKIKHENLKPKSIWYFLIKDYSLWLAVLLSVLLASLSIAPIIFIFSNIEPAYIKHVSANIYFFLLMILPYPWIILCAITTYLAQKIWSKTKNGYKFQGKYVVIISTITSLILGIILNIFAFGKIMDDQGEKAGFGFYKSMDGRKQENWFNPHEGRLIGIVQSISSSTSSTTFILFNEKNNFTEEISYDETVPGSEFISENNKLRIIGFENSDKDFFACAIFPDNFEPGKTRNISKIEVMKEKRDKIKQRFETNPECKESFENGRANFKPIQK